MTALIVGVTFVLEPVVRLWYRIRQPRVERAAYLLVYTVLAIGGSSVLNDPPRSIEGELGAALTFTWGGFLLVGGVAGAAAVMPGWWFLEKMGVASLATGLALYASTVGWLHFSEGSGNRLPQLCVVSAPAILLALRAWKIRGLDYEPRR